jgi:hypothetical protein
MYGIELLVLMLATVLVAITSAGVLSGTHRLAWFVSWRFIMGIGIGGDYPLSAVVRICSHLNANGDMLWYLVASQSDGIRACHKMTRTYWSSKTDSNSPRSRLNLHRGNTEAKC